MFISTLADLVSWSAVIWLGLLIDREAHDDGRAVERQRRIVDEDVAVVLELGMEGDRPQALLDEAGLHVAAERVDIRQIEEGVGKHLAVLVDDFDAPDTFDDEDAARAVIRDGHADRIVEAVRDLYESELLCARDFAAGTRDFGR